MGIIGSAFLGYTRVYGAGEDRLPIPLNGLVAWYDASDYTSGATWIDKSGNGNDLTLSGTYSLDPSTLGGPSLLLNDASGVTSGGPGRYHVRCGLVYCKSKSNC